MKEEGVYFERQGRFSLMCGLHSINNMLCKQECTVDELNNICYDLSDSFINPHKHIFGGDYDVNVLLVALQKRGLQYSWWDNRQGQLRIQDDCVGLLINVKVEGLALLQKILRISDRHWLCVRRDSQRYYWCDSKEDGPREVTRRQVQEQIGGMMKIQAESQPQVIQLFRTKK